MVSKSWITLPGIISGRHTEFVPVRNVCAQHWQTNALFHFSFLTSSRASPSHSAPQCHGEVKSSAERVACLTHITFHQTISREKNARTNWYQQLTVLHIITSVSIQVVCARIFLVKSFGEVKVKCEHVETQSLRASAAWIFLSSEIKQVTKRLTLIKNRSQGRF